MIDQISLFFFSIFCWSFVIIGLLTLLAVKLGWLPGLQEQWEELKKLKIYIAFSSLGGISSFLEILGQVNQPILLVPLVIGSMIGIATGVPIMKKVWKQNESSSKA